MFGILVCALGVHPDRNVIVLEVSERAISMALRYSDPCLFNHPFMDTPIPCAHSLHIHGPSQSTHQFLLINSL